MMDEKQIIERLDDSRRLAGAELLAVFDVKGFMKFASHDLTENEISQLIGIFCSAMNEIHDIKKVFPKSKPGFMIANLSNRYLYITSISDEICLMGSFSAAHSLLKVIQSMGTVEEEVKKWTGELERILDKKKKDFLSQHQKREVKPSPQTSKTQSDQLTLLQVEALLEEFVNELGPAARVIFNDTLKEMALDIKSLRKDQAVELVHTLANEIENMRRKERFIKTALNIIES